MLRSYCRKNKYELGILSGTRFKRDCLIDKVASLGLYEIFFKQDVLFDEVDSTL